MMHGRNNGKKLMAIRIVKHAFEIIHLLTGEVSQRKYSSAKNSVFFIMLEPTTDTGRRYCQQRAEGRFHAYW